MTKGDGTGHKAATSIYGPKEFIDAYRGIVREKLGLSLSERLLELAHQDNEFLMGKPDVSPGENIRNLQTRLTTLARRRDETAKPIDDRTFKDLLSIARDDYHISFKPPEKAKEAIGAMIKDFKAGKFDEVNQGDFQSFIGYAELSIEYHMVLDALTLLRNKKYGPSDEQASNPVRDALETLVDALQNLEDPYVKDLQAHWSESMTPQQLEEWSLRNPLVKKLLDNPAVQEQVTKLLLGEIGDSEVSEAAETEEESTDEDDDGGFESSGLNDDEWQEADE